MFWAPYNMSKHALESYTDDLAAEMSLFGVKVSATNPGNYNSRIGTKEAAALAKKPYAQPGSVYAEHIAADIEYMSDHAFSYSDEELVQMLREAIAAQRQ